MPVVIKQNIMKYKSDTQHEYIGINAIADRTTAEQIEDIQDAGATVLEQVETAITQSQEAVDGIDNQRTIIIEAISSVAGQGTDTTLTQPGVAADAATVGELIHVSQQAPTASAAKIWFKNNEEEYDVPTLDEFNSLKETLAGYLAEVKVALMTSNIQNAIAALDMAILDLHTLG